MQSTALDLTKSELEYRHDAGVREVEFSALIYEAIEFFPYPFAIYRADGSPLICNSSYRESGHRPDLTGAPPAAGQAPTFRSAGRTYDVTQQSMPSGTVTVMLTPIRAPAAAPPAEPRKLKARDVLEAIDQGFAIFDENDNLVVANQTYKQIFTSIVDKIVPGTPFETLIRTAAERHQNIEALTDPEAWVQGRLAKHRAAAGVYEHKFSDGRWIQVRERKTAVGQTIGTYTDVTSLIRRTEELAEARDRLEAVSRRMKGIIEASSDWIWSSNADGQVSCELQISRGNDDFDPAPHIAAALRSLIAAEQKRTAAAGDGTSAVTLRGVIHPVSLADGRALFLKINGKAVLTDLGVLEGYIGTASDETEKITIQQEAAHHTAVLEGVLDSIPQGVVVFSPDQTTVMSNRQATEILGTAIRDGDPIEALEPCAGKDVVQKLRRWAAAGNGLEMETAEFQTPAESTVAMRASFKRTNGFVVTFTDVTEQRKAATLTHQSQKLMALGELTGGVAHEFNNLLTSIGGFSRMAKQHADNAETVTECLEEVVAAADRAADLTRQMLTFSRKDHFEEKTVVAADIARSLGKMMKPLLPETVEFVTEIDDDTTCVKVDVAQVSQAVMNLILNARDAMPNGGGVVLRVRKGAGPDGSDPGKWMIFSVADDGTGIDEQTLPRIFDPFFTTKEQGKGTGLGLSVVHGIVQRCGGTITVESLVGVGTTFLIFLPVAGGEADAVPAPEEMPAPTSRGETILVVEDEPGVRRLVVKTLEAQGYRVLVAADHASAADALAASDDPPALLLTDVVLPGKSGPEIAAELRERFAGIKVLFMSGYIAPGIENLGLISDDETVLSKPFAPETLCQAVSDMLSGAEHTHTEPAERRAS